MQPGAIVAGGKYRVERILGRGGMGIVVEATHIHLETRVALKFLDESMVNEPTAIARFLREARACAQLKSENICRVSDFGIDGKVPFIVMELLEGSDLAKLVRSRTLDVTTAATYVIQACAGLTEAHNAHIVHRDLKPGNLFVVRRPDGSEVVKVVDFGVAKVETTGVGLTAASSVVGSPGFMSPEQVRASKSVDARADVWSLGVILYKLVSGRMPFKADTFAEFALAVVHEPMPPLPDVSPGLAAVIARCLEKDPDRRFASVADLAAALAPFAMTTIALPAPSTAAPRTAAAKTTLLGGSGMHNPIVEAVVPTSERATLMTAAISTPAEPLSEHLATGTIVGEYRIERKIGEGGMGVVYAAIHPLIGKKAAIKVISAGLGTDASTVQRFVQEARSVNQIGHPNIVDVFAFGNLPDGRNYFVMEHLQGESLRERLARTALMLGDALEILDEIAAALEAAHEKHIVHRDLKPDNIYLASIRGGRIIVKLLDFGIAKLAVAEGPGVNGIAKTRTGMMMGTPAYLSPEQARGTNVGFPTDIYALGCMVYEMVCGRLPFRANSAMDMVLMHIQAAPQPPSEVWPSIPPALEQLILQMLAKDPERRPSLATIRNVFTELVTSGIVPIEQGSGTFRSELRSRRPSEAPSYRTPPPEPPTNVRPPAPAHGYEPPSIIVAHQEPEAPKKKSGRGVAIAVALVLAVAVGVTLVVTQQGGDPAAAASPSKPAVVAPSPPLKPADGVPVVPAAKPPEPVVVEPAKPGLVAIQVNTDGARIEVDGVGVQVIGRTAKVPEAAGSHHVVVTAPNRLPYEADVHVDAGATASLDVKLERPRHGTNRPVVKPGPGSGSAHKVPSGPNDSTVDPFN